METALLVLMRSIATASTSFQMDKCSLIHHVKAAKSVANLHWYKTESATGVRSLLCTNVENYVIKLQ